MLIIDIYYEFQLLQNKMAFNKLPGKTIPTYIT